MVQKGLTPYNDWSTTRPGPLNAAHNASPEEERHAKSRGRVALLNSSSTVPSNMTSARAKTSTVSSTPTSTSTAAADVCTQATPSPPRRCSIIVSRARNPRTVLDKTISAVTPAVLASMAPRSTTTPAAAGSSTARTGPGSPVPSATSPGPSNRCSRAGIPAPRRTSGCMTRLRPWPPAVCSDHVTGPLKE